MHRIKFIFCLQIFIAASACGKFTPIELADEKPLKDDDVIKTDLILCDDQILSGTEEVRIRFQTSEVEKGQVCKSESQSRICNTGKYSQWTGSYVFEACSVDGGTSTLASCSGVSHGTAESRIRFQSASVAYNSTCKQELQTRTCNNSNFTDWTGTFNQTNCFVQPPPNPVNNKPCGPVAHGTIESRIKFAAATVPSGQTCQQETQTRTCNNGAYTNWSGAFAAAACEVLPLVEMSLSAGVYRRYCVTIGNTSVKCWGTNSQYELGLGHNDVVTLPSQVNFVANNLVGNSHTCGIFGNGDVKCWGLNNYGQLGRGNISNATSPDVVTTSNAKKIVAGSRHTCVMHNLGAVTCFGDNNAGQIAQPATNRNVTSPQVVPDFIASDISSSAEQTCAIRASDNAVFCWGTSFITGVSTSTFTPKIINGVLAKSVASGYYHSCAIKLDNSVVCWGMNTSAQLGQGQASNASGPVTVPGISAKAISAGGNHTCAILLDDSLWCWGANSRGQLGRFGISTYSGTPTTVFGGFKARQVEMGIDSTCAIGIDNTVQCWGANDAYHLGTGDTLQQNKPAPVKLN